MKCRFNPTQAYFSLIAINEAGEDQFSKLCWVPLVDLNCAIVQARGDFAQVIADLPVIVQQDKWHFGGNKFQKSRVVPLDKLNEVIGMQSPTEMPAKAVKPSAQLINQIRQVLGMEIQPETIEVVAIPAPPIEIDAVGLHSNPPGWDVVSVIDPSSPKVTTIHSEGVTTIREPEHRLETVSQVQEQIQQDLSGALANIAKLAEAGCDVLLLNKMLNKLTQ